MVLSAKRAAVAPGQVPDYRQLLKNPAQQNYDYRNENDVKAKKSLAFSFNQLVDRNGSLALHTSPTQRTVLSTDLLSSYTFAIHLIDNLYIYCIFLASV